MQGILPREVEPVVEADELAEKDEEVVVVDDEIWQSTSVSK